MHKAPAVWVLLLKGAGRPGGDVWKEKLDYTVSWLTAHIQDAGQLGKPLLTEEFGKAISAAKVYTGELPKTPQKGEAPFAVLTWLRCLRDVLGLL